MNLVRHILGLFTLSTLSAVCANAAITPEAPTVDATDGCYLIGSKEQLYGFAAIANGDMSGVSGAATPYCAKLTADITVNTDVLNATDRSSLETWIPIGKYSTKPFVGSTFDGQGHVISGLYRSVSPYVINQETGTTDPWNGVGLFGNIKGSFTIKNLGIVDSYFYGNKYVGSFVGYATESDKLTFVNCFGRNEISGFNNAGGFGGDAKSIVISNSYVTGNVECRDEVQGEDNKTCGVFFSRPLYASDSYENIYYLDGMSGYHQVGIKKTSSEFADGSVVSKLFSAKNGGIWRQANADAYPNFTGNVVKSVDVCFLDYNDGRPAEWIPCGTRLPKPTRVGYRFEWWLSVYDDPFAVMPSDPGTTLKASWKALVEPSLGEDGCYELESDLDLFSFAAIVNGTFAEGRAAESKNCAKLTADITVNSHVLNTVKNNNNVVSAVNASDTSLFVPWTPINGFEGTFDGQGHVISGLYDYDPSGVLFGVFGMVKGNTTIKNLGVEDSYFHGNASVGGIVAVVKEQSSLTMLNCYSRSVVRVEYAHLGGLVGGADNPFTLPEGAREVKINIRNCYVAGGIINGTASDYGAIIGAPGMRTQINVHNTYYLFSLYSNTNFGESQGFEQFDRGETVALLFNDAEGRIWRQGYEDIFPSFKDDIVKNVSVCRLHYSQNEVKWQECIPQKLPHKMQGDSLLYDWYQSDNYSGSPLDEIPNYILNGADFYAKWVHLAVPQVVDGCYQISSPVDLFSFAAIVNGKLAGDTKAKTPYCAKLTKDITINNNVLNAQGTDVNAADSAAFISWTPIGSTFNKAFTGTFDGDGHVISGLYINAETFLGNEDQEPYQRKGLFGSVKGTVKWFENFGRQIAVS